MRDENKTKEQLINELAELRQQIFELKETETQRTHLEEELKRSEERYRLMNENTNDLIAITTFTLNPTYTYISPSHKKVLGYDSEELIGKSGLYFLHPEDKKNLLPLLRKYIKAKTKKLFSENVSGASKTIEYRMRDKSGKWHYLESTISIIKDEILFHSRDITERKRTEMELQNAYDELERRIEEWTIGISNAHEVLGVEITERKKFEEALKRSEEKYYNLIEFANVGIIASEDGKITHANKQAEKIYGYSKEELVGQSPRMLTPEKYSTHHREILNEFLRSGKISKMIFEEEGIKKDGTLFPIEISFSLSQAVENTVIAVIRDISERKKVEEALKKSEERYHKLIEHASDAIICINNDGVIITFNKKAGEIFGFDCDEVIGKFITLLSPINEREKQRKLLEQFRLTNELYIIGKTMEGKGLRKDGHEFPFEGSVFTLEINGEYILTVILRDISERKKAEKERKHLLDELKDKNKELEQIVYVASHDLRSPLVNVQGFSRELEQALTKVCLVLHSKDVPTKIKEELATALEEDIPDALQYILISISKMDFLLSGLLRLSRLGRAALNIKHLDMNKLISDSVRAFEYQIKKTGITLQIDQLPSCFADETQINQVISNLLDNALKYLDTNRPGIIRISGKIENGHVLYYIEDNGIGIAVEHQDKIYEIFHRLNPAATPGEGLGLTIARRILDRHAGKIWVESEPGKGSTFFISLPTI